MGYYLLDNRNPNAGGDGFHGYAGRRGSVTAVAIHTAESNPSSSSATAIGNYFSKTARQASYHTGVDSSQALGYLPYGYTAFHVRGFNSPSLGLSFCTRASLWGKHPNWDEAALRNGAAELKRMCDTYDIPIRRISANQAKAGTKGIVSHAQMDPARRSDPGANFPWDTFMQQARGQGTSGTFPISRGHKGAKVLEWQEMLLEQNPRALPTYGADGDFGEETAVWTRNWQKGMGRTESGAVGETDWNALKEQLGEQEREEEETTYDIAVVYESEIDEGMAWVLGPAYTWKVLPGDRLHLVNDHALLIGSAQKLADECREKGIEPHPYAGAGRKETGHVVANKIKANDRTP